MYELKDIKVVHLEVTQNCQAACPMCDRNCNGEGINPHINLDELSLKDCKDIFNTSFIKQLDTMYMCGNLGDPIIARDTLEIFKYFRKHNPNMWLNMNTNAGARNNIWWQELADIFGSNGSVIFSVDGLEDTNHIYRQGVSWKAVERSMDAFIEAGGRARWDFLIFEHNQHQVEEAKSLSQQKGFETFTAKKTRRFIKSKGIPKDNHKFGDKSLNKPDPKYINPALATQDKVIEKYSSMVDYFNNTKITCKVKDKGEIFVSAEGLVLPCCWTAGRMYKWKKKDPHVEQIWDHIELAGGKESLNAKNGIDKVFNTNIFKSIQDSWKIPTCKEGKLKICTRQCGQEFKPFESQWN